MNNTANVSGVVNTIINVNSTVTGTAANLATLSGQFVTLSGQYNTTSGIVTTATGNIASLSGSLNTVSGVAYAALPKSGGTISGALVVQSGFTASGVSFIRNNLLVSSGLTVTGTVTFGQSTPVSITQGIAVSNGTNSPITITDGAGTGGSLNVTYNAADSLTHTFYLPALTADDTMVGQAFAQTLTNKKISGGIFLGSTVASGTLTVVSGATFSGATTINNTLTISGITITGGTTTSGYVLTATSTSGASFQPAAGGGGGSYLPISGGTISGNLIVASGLTVSGTTTLNNTLTISGGSGLVIASGYGALINTSNVGSPSQTLGLKDINAGNYAAWFRAVSSGGGGGWQTINNAFTNPTFTVSDSGNVTVPGSLTVNGTATFATPPSIMGKWVSTSLTSAVINTGTPIQNINVVVSGYTNYLINFDMQGLNGDTTTGRNVVAYIYQGTSPGNVAQKTSYAVANQLVSIHVTHLVTGLSAGTAYTFYGETSQGGSSPGTVQAAEIIVLGFN